MAVLSFIVVEVECSHTDNHSVTGKAHPVRNHTKNKEAEACRKNNLRIIVNADFAGRGVEVSRCNGKLTAGSPDARKNKKSQLKACHSFPVKNHVGKRK